MVALVQGGADMVNSVKQANEYAIMPSAAHAGAYSATMHYLKAVAYGKTIDGQQVVVKMKAMPVTDPLMGPGTLRIDGRMVHEMYLLQVKTPAGSTWDVYKILKKMPGNAAFRALATACSLVK